MPAHEHGTRAAATGLWRWTARHPEWHPGDFGAEVACFAAQAGEDTLLIDPLLPEDPEPVHELIEQCSGRAWRFSSRSPTTCAARRSCASATRGRPTAPSGATPRRPSACAGRAASTRSSRARPCPEERPRTSIGKPRRQETPLLLPSHRALVFGDAVAETGGRLRVWSAERVDDRVARFYRERFNPTLKPLLELDFDGVLVTHGEPVLRDGRRALASALRSKPWYHRG